MKAKKRPSRADKEAMKRNSILDAAAECFMQRGFDATTIDQIADLLGCTKGQIYYYFDSKTDLFFEVYRRTIVRTIERVDSIAHSEMSAMRRLHAMARGHIIGIMEHLADHHVSKQGVELHRANALTPEQGRDLRTLMDLRDTYEHFFTQVIAEGVEDGSVRDCTPSLAARTLLGSLNGFSVWYRPRASQAAADREALADKVVDIILNGLSARTL